MKRKLVMLSALICFLSPYAWGDTAPPAAAPADIGSSIEKSSGSITAPKGNDPVKSEVKNPSEPPAKCAGEKKCCGWFVVISLIPAFLFLVFLLVVKQVLQKNNWNLGDALSESEPLKDQTGTIVNGADGKPVFARSASRFMAFIGFFAIVVWIVGLSIPTLYRFACTGEVADLSKISTFLLAQAGIFAPYVANKLAGAIKS